MGMFKTRKAEPSLILALIVDNFILAYFITSFLSYERLRLTWITKFHEDVPLKRRCYKIGSLPKIRIAFSRILEIL